MKDVCSLRYRWTTFNGGWFRSFFLLGCFRLNLLIRDWRVWLIYMNVQPAKIKQKREKNLQVVAKICWVQRKKKERKNRNSVDNDAKKNGAMLGNGLALIMSIAWLSWKFELDETLRHYGLTGFLISAPLPETPLVINYRCKPSLSSSFFALVRDRLIVKLQIIFFSGNLDFQEFFFLSWKKEAKKPKCASPPGGMSACRRHYGHRLK